MRGVWIRAVGILGCALAWGCMADPSVDDGHRFPSSDEPEVKSDEKKKPAKDEKEGSCLGADCTKTPDEGQKSADSDAGPQDGCAAALLCSDAEDLGTIAGDVVGEERSRQASGSRFYSINVTEDDQNVTGAAMILTATLVSPPGANYDIYLYADACGGEPVARSTKGAGTTDKATFTWGEGVFPNGGLDNRTILIEVRNANETCEANDKFTLVVRGATS